MNNSNRYKATCFFLLASLVSGLGLCRWYAETHPADLFPGHTVTIHFIQ